MLITLIANPNIPWASVTFAGQVSWDGHRLGTAGVGLLHTLHALVLDGAATAIAYGLDQAFRHLDVLCLTVALTLTCWHAFNMVNTAGSHCYQFPELLTLVAIPSPPNHVTAHFRQFSDATLSDLACVTESIATRRSHLGGEQDENAEINHCELHFSNCQYDAMIIQNSTTALIRTLAHVIEINWLHWSRNTMHAWVENGETEVMK